MFWEYIKAIIYGFIEGITEWLPISSTGHLILLEEALRIDIGASDRLTEQFSGMFDVVIQLGAILAVLFMYSKELIPLGKRKKDVFSLWQKLSLATIPAAIIGLGADIMCEKYFGVDLDTLLFNPKTVASALIVYGILFILVEKLTAHSKKDKDITPRSALAIGFFQSLAIIPGTSRSGATILGARILGIPREKAARFSFFAAIPVIAAASLLKIYDFAKFTASSAEALSPEAYLILLTAALTAFLLSLAAIRFLTDFVKKHTFIPFGIYRIVLGIAVLIFIK